MKKKLFSRKGESLVEAMAALVIIVLVIAMLPTALVSAARVNRESSDIITTCQKNGTEAYTVSVTLDGASYTPAGSSVIKGYTDIGSKTETTPGEDSFYYYMVG